jgi:hypothetical protein
MHDIKRQLRLYKQITPLLLLLVVVIQLLSCNQKYDNPVGPDYVGNYALEEIKSDVDTSTTLEIFKEYYLTFRNTGVDPYWKTYLSSNSSHLKSEPKKNIIDTATINFSFGEPCTTLIYLVGERPNRTKNPILLDTISVINPYRINGDSIVSFEDTVSLSIERLDQATSPFNFNEIKWNNLDTKKGGSDIKFAISHTEFDTEKIIATISAKGESFTLDTFTVYFKSHALEMKLIDTIDSLPLGKPALFNISCRGDTAEFLHFIISTKEDTLLDTKFLNNITTFPLLTDTISDTGIIKIDISVDNGHDLSKKISIRPKITTIKPSVIPIQYDSVPFINKDSIILRCEGQSDFYHWKYHKKDTITQQKTITLPPYSDTLVDTIFVFGEKQYNFTNKKNISIFSKTVPLIIKPQRTIYTTDCSPSFISTKQWDSLHAVVKNGDHIVPEDSLKYVWTLSDSVSGDTITGSKIKLYLRDSLPNFIVTLKVYSATDSNNLHAIAGVTKSVITRSYRPKFTFAVSALQDSLFTYKLLYSATDTIIPGHKDSILSIGFKQISGPLLDTATYTISNGDSMIVHFKVSGDYTVAGWAMDNDSNTSEVDTIRIKIKVTQPEFNKDTIFLYKTIGDTVLLQSQLLNAMPVNRYFWDTNGDGIWDDTSSNQSYKKIVFKPLSDSVYLIHTQCRSGAGDTALKRLTFRIEVKENKPVITSFTVNKSLNYINKDVIFSFTGYDPDSSLTKAYLYRSDSKGDSLMDSTTYKNTKNTDSKNSFKVRFEKPIIDSFYLVLQDKNNYKTYSASITDTIDQGVPKINIFEVPAPSKTVNESFVFYIDVSDPDSGFKSVSLYRSTSKDDSTLIVSFKDTIFFYGYTNIKYGGYSDNPPQSSDHYSYFIICTDNNGNTIKSDVKETTIGKGIPVVERVAFSTASQFINKACKFTIKANDNERIDSIYIFSQLLSQSTDSLVYTIVCNSNQIDITDSIKFSKAGTYRIKAQAFDNNANISIKIASQDSIIINQGIPEAKFVLHSVPQPYVFDTVSFTVTATDNDTAGRTYAISYGDSSHFTPFVPSNVFKNAYPDSGKKILYVKVKDIDNQNSSAFKDSIVILKGIPTVKITSITPKTGFVLKPIQFTLSAKDTNGNIDSVFADWNDDFKADAFIVNTSDEETFSFNYSFPINTVGNRKIHFWASDDDGILSSFKDTTVTIRLGAPKYNGIVLADTSKYWANDNLTFKFNCVDTNGNIRKFIVNWNDGKKIDTILVTTLTSGVADTITDVHTFPIVNDSTYIVSITLIDDDAIAATFSDMIRVKRGLPVVTIPGGGDTLFSRIANTGGNTTLSINSYDPNDTITQYYWILGGSSFDTSNATYKNLSTSLDLTGRSSSDVNKSYGRSAVLAKDKDGNVAGDTFEIYLDGPPPAPTIVFPISTTQSFGISDTITFEWYGTDVHDSVNTQFKLSIKPPGEHTSWKEITSYISGSQLNTEIVGGIIHFKYKYFPSDGQGSYLWKVEALDRSESNTSSNQESFYHN